MALLQFMQAGKDKVAVPTTVHCDHLILAQSGALKDLKNANKVSSEVFKFLESVSKNMVLDLETWCWNYSSSNS